MMIGQHRKKEKKMNRLKKIMKSIGIAVVGVVPFVSGIYYASYQFEHYLDSVMVEYEVISNKVDTFEKVSDPKTIRNYVNELNKILDDIEFLHKLIETGQLADVALTELLDKQGSVVSRMDSLHLELSTSITDVKEYNTAQDVVDEHTKVLINLVNENLDNHKKYIEDFNNQMTQLQMKLDMVNKEVEVVKSSKFGKKIWGKK